MTQIEKKQKNISQPIERWKVPRLSDQSKSSAASLTHITVEKIERLRRDAYKEAYKSGFEKGFAKGEADGLAKVQAKITLLDKLAYELSQPFDEMEEEIENQLAQLAILIAKQIIRRQIDNDPGQIVAIVREAIALLPITANSMHVRVHPEDYKVLQDIVHLTSDKNRINIEEDVSLQRGDCKVFTEYSSIDATLQTRMTALVTEMLGGHRSSDSSTTNRDSKA